MKCSYQTKVIHKPQYTEGYIKSFAEDITEFCECLKSECPFYYTTEYKPARHVKEHCRRAESEDKCKNCKYYRNPDYTRCHECKAESEE